MRKVVSIILFLTFLSCNNNKESKQPAMPELNGPFATPEWVHTTNIYEVNVRQYTQEGTLNAFAKELTRLNNMGVKTLWFMPLTPIAKKNRKGGLGSYYACSDYTSINSEFGTMDDFKNIVKEAHAMGMKVIIDWVANHTGWDHWWTKDHPDYYLKDPKTKDFQIASGMDDIIELDFSNPKLERAMIDAMKFWINECDIDGFRCDLAFWVELPFWKKARRELDAVKPLFWLGEFDELDNPEYGEVFDASYTWKWMHLTEDWYKKKMGAPDTLYSLLKKYDDLGDSTMRAWFTTNHDENSWNGTEFEKYDKMAVALAAFSCTWNGIPLIYSGQEIPNTDRLLFFDRKPIVWLKIGNLRESFYKTLFELRTNNPALRGGDSTVQTYRIKTTANNVFAYLRKKDNHEVLVILNLSHENNLRFDITDERVSGIFKNAFSKAANDFTTERSFEMMEWEFLVYAKDTN